MDEQNLLNKLEAHLDEWQRVVVPGSFLDEALFADAHRAVPAAGGHGPPVRRARVAHHVPAVSAVVLGEQSGELLVTVGTLAGFVVRHPVTRPGRVLDQAYKKKIKKNE